MADTKTVHMVFCAKLQKELPGLDEIPFDGHPLGKRIYDSVSKDAWKQWVEHMKMIMNEYRLSYAGSLELAVSTRPQSEPELNVSYDSRLHHTAPPVNPPLPVAQRTGLETSGTVSESGYL